MFFLKNFSARRAIATVLLAITFPIYVKASGETNIDIFDWCDPYRDTVVSESSPDRTPPLASTDINSPWTGKRYKTIAGDNTGYGYRQPKEKGCGDPHCFEPMFFYTKKGKILSAFVEDGFMNSNKADILIRFDENSSNAGCTMTQQCETSSEQCNPSWTETITCENDDAGLQVEYCPKNKPTQDGTGIGSGAPNRNPM